MEVGNIVIVIMMILFGYLYFASVFILLYVQFAETLSNH